MAKKMQQKLVVGRWRDISNTGVDTGIRVFEPNPKQPPEPMTEINDIVAWAKKEFEGALGTYEFIRVVPGALECFQQTVMDFKVEKEEESV